MTLAAALSDMAGVRGRACDEITEVVRVRRRQGRAGRVSRGRVAVMATVAFALGLGISGVVARRMAGPRAPAPVVTASPPRISPVIVPLGSTPAARPAALPADRASTPAPRQRPVKVRRRSAPSPDLEPSGPSVLV